MRRLNLAGAACADLPDFVVDKYFHSDTHRDTFAARTAKAICSHCIVQPECLEQALNTEARPTRGIVAGVTGNAIRVGRAWRIYELGLRDTPPRTPRPEWLARPEATETAEQTLVEAELGVEL